MTTYDSSALTTTSAITFTELSVSDHEAVYRAQVTYGEDTLETNIAAVTVFGETPLKHLYTAL